MTKGKGYHAVRTPPNFPYDGTIKFWCHSFDLCPDIALVTSINMFCGNRVQEGPEGRIVIILD